jgi:hypothetical protein
MSSKTSTIFGDITKNTGFLQWEFIFLPKFSSGQISTVFLPWLPEGQEDCSMESFFWWTQGAKSKLMKNRYLTDTYLNRETPAFICWSWNLYIIDKLQIVHINCIWIADGSWTGIRISGRRALHSARSLWKDQWLSAIVNITSFNASIPIPVPKSIYKQLIPRWLELVKLELRK